MVKEIAGPVHDACGHVVDKSGQCRCSFFSVCDVQGLHQLQSEFRAPISECISAVHLCIALVVHVHARLGANCE